MLEKFFNSSATRDATFQRACSFFENDLACDGFLIAQACGSDPALKDEIVAVYMRCRLFNAADMFLCCVTGMMLMKCMATIPSTRHLELMIVFSTMCGCYPGFSLLDRYVGAQSMLASTLSTYSFVLKKVETRIADHYATRQSPAESRMQNSQLPL